MTKKKKKNKNKRNQKQTDRHLLKGNSRKMLPTGRFLFTQPPVSMPLITLPYNSFALSLFLFLLSLFFFEILEGGR